MTHHIGDVNGVVIKNSDDNITMIIHHLKIFIKCKTGERHRLNFGTFTNLSPSSFRYDDDDDDDVE